MSKTGATPAIFILLLGHLLVRSVIVLIVIEYHKIILIDSKALGSWKAV